MRYLLTVFSLLGWVSILWSGSGETACGFLKFSNSAKSSSLGGAYSAYPGGADMIFSNPAGGVNLQNSEVYFAFSNYISNSKLVLLSYLKKKDNLSLGLGVGNFVIDSIERRTQDSKGIVPSQGFFNARDSIVLFTFSKYDFLPSLMDNLSGGVNLKIINSKIDSDSAYAFAIDAGILYPYQQNIIFSFVLMNLGSKIKYHEFGDKLPLSIKAGGYYRHNDSIGIVGEIEEYIYDERFYPSIGFEWNVKKSLAIRTGYRFGYDRENLGNFVGFSLGIGVVANDVSFNYSYSPFGELGDINKFDISLKF
ncbi:MAG: PorV/PorQ family protein [Elusimicrobiales bacterium]